MQIKFPHNHYNSSEFFPSLKVNFADGNEGSKIRTGTRAGFKKTEALTNDQKRKITQLGLREEQFKGASALDSRIIDKLHKNTTLREGTYPKDPQNPHYLLMKAMADGKFPDRGKHIPRFLEAIEGGENEKEAVMKMLKEIRGHDGPLVVKNQEKYLQELDEARGKDAVLTAKKAAEETVSKVETNTEASQTNGKISDLTGINEAIEGPTPGKLKIGNWEVESPREGLMEELKTLAENYQKLSKKYITAYKECEKVAAELRAPNLDSSKKESLTARLHALEQQKLEMEREMASLKEKAKEAREEYEAWGQRALSMFRKFDTLLSESGIDLRDAEKLKRWFFDQVALNDPKSSSLELGGTVTNPETGLTTKKIGTLTITRVYFDPIDLPKDAKKDPNLRTAIGELMVEFVDEQGIKSEVGYAAFLKKAQEQETHESGMTMEELNQRIGKQTHFKSLAKGDKFSAKVLKGFNEKGDEVYENEEFEIERIDEEEGKEPLIILNRSVTKTEKERLAYSVHPSLYFDREQREFDPGEFEKFIMQHKFSRVLTPQDSLQKVMDGEVEARRKTAAKYGFSAEDLGNIDLPKPGEPPKKIKVHSDSGEPRDAYISRKGSSDEYEIEMLIPDGPETSEDRFARMEEGMSAGLAGAVTGLISGKMVSPKSYRVERVPLSLSSNAEMVHKGNVTVAPEGEHPEGEHPEGAPPTPEAPAHPEEQPPNAQANRQRAADTAAKEASTHSADLGAENAAAVQAAHAEKTLQEKKAKEEETVKKPKEIKAEALPYDQIYKTGGMSYPERGFLRKLWDTTRILSVSDLWAMGKSGYDYYQRRWERRQKDKYSSIGEDLPFFGSEMRRIKQAAENEEVHQFHESFAKKGVFEIEERLRKTSNKDEMKACIEDLAEKGHIRWDDIEMWKNLNRFVPDPRRLIPIPSNGDPYTHISEHDERTGLDCLQGAIDSIWGEATYDQWVSKDKSTRQSGARTWYEKGKELEIIQGGHRKALEKLMHRHKNGEFVDPMEYEGLILHMIDAGKSTMETKLYFIVAGATAENHHGHTILSFDRVGHINSEMLNQFPILEYLTAEAPRMGPDGKPKAHRFTKDDYKRWLEYFDNGNPMNCGPTEKVHEFLWRYVIPSYENETRCNKALRNADKLDHDDMFAYLPPASTAILTNACRTVGGGGKHLLTSEGYANAAPGFSQYFKTLAEHGNYPRLQQAVKSYIRFEAILMERWDKTNKDFYRMDNNTLNRKTVVSTTPPGVFFKELNGVVRKIADAYDNDELREMINLIQTDTRGLDMKDKNNEAFQHRIQQALIKFDDTFESVVAADKGEKMMNVINGTNLIGMSFGDVMKGREAPKEAGSEFAGLGGGHGHH